jgi:hypothetical protein
MRGLDITETFRELRAYLICLFLKGSEKTYQNFLVIKNKIKVKLPPGQNHNAMEYIVFRSKPQLINVGIIGNSDVEFSSVRENPSITSS